MPIVMEAQRRALCKRTVEIAYVLAHGRADLSALVIILLRVIVLAHFVVIVFALRLCRAVVLCAAVALTDP